jgi:hypothetical protein
VCSARRPAPTYARPTRRPMKNVSTVNVDGGRDQKRFRFAHPSVALPPLPGQISSRTPDWLSKVRVRSGGSGTAYRREGASTHRVTISQPVTPR